MRKQFLLLLTAILCVLNVWAQEKPSWVRDGDNWFDGTLIIFSNLGASAYAKRTEIVQVMFATGVSTIGESAFAGCTNITLVMLAEVSSIGDSAFSGCTGLTSITFPNYVTSIGNGAFANCTGFTSLTIPSYVANIGNGAFAGCSNITDVKCYPNAAGLTWGDASSDFKASKATRCHVYPSQLSAYQTKFPNANLTFVGDLPPEWVQPGDEWDYETSTLTVNSNPGSQAYQWNADILHVIFSDAVTNTGEQTFFNCEGLTTVTIGDNVDTIGPSAFLQCYALTTVTMGNSVRVIEGMAFCSCNNLANIELPNSVTNIKSGAFSYCTSLTTFTIPKNVVEIGWQAFRYCNSVTDVYCYPLAANLEWSYEYDFQGGSETRCHVWPSQYMAYVNKFSGAHVSFYGDLFDPDPSVWVLDGDVWDADTKTLTVNSNPGNQAYDNNPLIQHVIISGTVTSIGVQAFSRCSVLESVTIPNSVESIGAVAFATCSNLATVTIGNSVTSIGDYGFADCTSLASLTCAAVTPPTLGGNVFMNVPTSTCTLYVPKGSEEDYDDRAQWTEFVTILPIDDGGTPTAIDQLLYRQSSNRKFIMEGQLLIEHNGKYFNVLGQPKH